jgi:mobilization protein MobC
MKKKNENEVRNKLVVIRMNKIEFEKAENFRKKSTERNISSYLRKLSLQKPVTIKYRNQSADDFLKDMLLLKKELNAIGNNFNQAVHKLHLLDRIPEFRDWVHQNDILLKTLVAKVEEIKLRMNQLYEEWLLK